VASDEIELTTLTMKINLKIVRVTRPNLQMLNFLARAIQIRPAPENAGLNN